MKHYNYKVIIINELGFKYNKEFKDLEESFKYMNITEKDHNLGISPIIEMILKSDNPELGILEIHEF